ncbi:uncharacterized protein LOC135351194 [Halichondria panicea]|uniref:uncharacterized protein LOC135351194 n=1 Tax=Halichondria panicea TaxID=6063 RepID=UPI00312B510F
MEDSSTAGVSRYIGDTATQPSLGGTDNEQLLRQPFINNSKQPSEQLLGEVSPREQDEDKAMGQEMVVTPIPEIAFTPGDASESSGHAKEESQSDSSAESLLVQGYSSEESSHDKLRSVSKDWVLNEIQKVKEDSKQERDKLSQQVSELTARFEKTDEELKSKQKELDQCQKELDTFKKQVKSLTEELEQEVSTRTELEDKLKMSTEQVKQREDKVGELEVVVKKLQEELKKEKQNNSTAETVDRLVRSHTDLIQELRQDNHKIISATQSDPGSPTETECKFSFLSGEAHPPDPQHNRTIQFIPSPTWPPSQLEHQNSVD